jgi:hypothetical protein
MPEAMQPGELQTLWLAKKSPPTQSEPEGVSNRQELPNEENL